MMRTVSRPRVSVGIIVFVVSMAALVFVAAPIQEALQMWGLALTELMLLALAIIPALRRRWPLREVFPMKIPSLAQVFGVLVLWLASYVAVYVTTVSLYYLFPAGMGALSTGLAEFFTSVPMPLALFIAAVMPAVCEEFLHRGLIQYTFKGKSKWVTVLSMGFIFGLFHLDMFRFLGSAILGGVLAYIMWETKNLLLPILLHFVNNAVSTSIGFVTQPNAGLMQALTAIGYALIAATIVPFLFIAGSRLLMSGELRKAKPIRKKTWVIATLLAVLLMAGGAAIVVTGPADPIFKTSFSQQVTREDRGHELPFTVERGGSYRLNLTIEGGGLITTILILDSTGDEIYRTSAGSVTSDTALGLDAGEYLVSVEYDYTGLECLPVSVDILIY